MSDVSEKKATVGKDGVIEEGASRSGDRPTTGVFSVIQEKWLAVAMLCFGLFTAGLWALQPEQEIASITASLRDTADWQNEAAARQAQKEGRADQQQAGGKTQVARLDGQTVDQLESRFAEYGYSLQNIRSAGAEVPRISPKSVPVDLNDVREVSRKKQVFLKMVLPLVLMVNERLSEQRARLEKLASQQAQGKILAADQKQWLNAMYESYRVKPGKMEELLRRVDVVPPSLALAQAAIESGWGTSRFAREGNALFGQWVWGDKAKGIVPEQRDSGKTHKIAAFDTPLEAVAAYIKNLNTHRAYRKLRDMRQALRAQDAGMNGLTLAGGLESYSEKGMEYVELVRNIIAANKLRPLDKARLADQAALPSNA